MNLNDAQRQQVAAWIADGLKLSDLQKRLETEFGLRLTYMEVRFLLDDLKIVPKDAPAPPPPPEAPKPSPAAQQNATPATADEPATLPDEVLPGAGQVKVGVDQIARPGAMVSGSVTFSDGQSGTWYLDQMGRLGLGMKQKGYRPSAADLEDFQMQLQGELAKAGF
ncbi:MAG: hypothetical protein HZA90_23695 [Verrucomicrobia bacterium]|nr:hypothetical protein [Verrucomicrobiota bacterium]